MAATGLPYFAACASGLEYLLVDELKALGAETAREQKAGVAFDLPAERLIDVVLQSRLASRVLRILVDSPVADAEALYQLALKQDWPALFDVSRRFRVQVSGTHLGIAHTGFAALKVKDAVADRFREATGDRPSVDADDAEVSVDLHLEKLRAVLSLDVSGPLHQRGYRLQPVAAPLRETLAAGLLLRAGWPAIAAEGGALVDPCCGAGTLLIEALWMAAGVPPTWLTPRLPIEHLKDTDLAAFAARRRELDAAANEGLRNLKVRVYGSDIDPAAIAATRKNALAARIVGHLRLQTSPLASLKKPADAGERGVLIANPPYGERLGEERALIPLYREFGRLLHGQFAGWTGGLITTSDTLIQAVARPIVKRYRLRNGPLDATFALYDSSRAPVGAKPLSEGSQMVANRIERNQRRLKDYLTRRQISCYRIYDADIPEYNAAIDVYGDRLHVQEYAAPREIPEADTRRRLDELCEAARAVYGLPAEALHLKRRERQRGHGQYQRREAATPERFQVDEDGLSFEVDLDSYLDTGLFLDSREVRRRLRALALGRDVLNLFCYTGTASVQAAAGGARSTLSIDLSSTYLDWAERNYVQNRLRPEHHGLLRADARDWLQRAAARPRQRYGLIYLDPPTFSNSKKMAGVLDIQRDHVALIEACMTLLEPDGVLVFVTNARSFLLDPELSTRFRISDTKARTLPPDFARNQRIHQSYELRHPA